MPASPKTSSFPRAFRQLARELNEARKQEVKLQHLMIRATRANIQAARLVIEGVNGDVFNRCPQLRSNLRFAWTGKIKGSGGTVTVDEQGRWHVKLLADVPEGDGAPLPVETASDEQLARLWVFPIMAVVRTLQVSSLKANPGTYDWKTIPKDNQGRFLGQDGKPLTYVHETLRDPDTGNTVSSWRLSGEPAYVGDEYDDADWLANCRARVGDWADACRALADLIAESETEKKRVGQLPVPQEVWLTVKICAELLLRDVSGLTLKKAMARVSDAATKNRFRTNGKKRNARRIDHDSFSTWRLEQRERDLDADNEAY